MLCCVVVCMPVCCGCMCMDVWYDGMDVLHACCAKTYSSAVIGQVSAMQD